MPNEIKCKTNITYFRIYLINGSKSLSSKLFSYVIIYYIYILILNFENWTCNILFWKKVKMFTKIFVKILCFNKKKKSIINKWKKNKHVSFDLF